MTTVPCRFGVFMFMVLLSLNAAAQDTAFDVTPRNVTVAKGGTTKLKLSNVANVSDVQLTGGQPSNVATFDLPTLTVTGTEPGQVELTLTHTPSQQAIKILVRVVDIATVKVEGHEKPLVEGEQRPITVVAQDKDGAVISDVPFEFTITPASGVIRIDPGPVIVATATNVKKTPVSASVSVSVSGKRIAPGGQDFIFTVKVAEPIARIEVFDPEVPISEGGQIDLRKHLRLHGKNASVYEAGERPLVLRSGEHLEIKDNRLLAAKDLPTVFAHDLTQFVTVASPEQAPDGQVPSGQMTVTIHLRAARLLIEPALIPLPRNGVSDVITAALLNRAGNAETFFDVTWTVQPEFDKYIGVVRLSNKTARVVWKEEIDPTKPPPRLVGLTASATRTTAPQAGSSDDGTGTAGDAPFTAEAFIRVLPTVAHFAQLRVRLNIMDDRTVADLFGEKTAKEFYVARVRLNNNLKKSDDGTELRGESILAFSESIEVAIGVEKRKPQKQRWWSPSDKSDPWLPLTNDEVQSSANTGAPPPLLFTYPFLKRSTSESPSAPPTEPVPACRGVLTYRPYTFEMIVNSGDPRYERSRRARTFRILSSIGTVASFVTSVAVPGPQSDIPLGLEKYTNLLIPGLQKLFPDIRDTQRQNIVSMTMKPIEEVPFGSDLSRVLFFPKGAFKGMLRGYETRISEICPHLFTIEVAVLDKSGKQTVTVDAAQ